jgi:hypothetical protein
MLIFVKFKSHPLCRICGLWRAKALDGKAKASQANDQGLSLETFFGDNGLTWVAPNLKFHAHVGY